MHEYDDMNLSDADIDNLEDVDVDDDAGELAEIDAELADLEREYAGDDTELGALPRRKVAQLRGRVARAKSKQKQKMSRAVKAAKKNAAVARSLRAKAMNDQAIGRLTGFRGPTGVSFASLGAAGTTTTLTARPQKDTLGGKLVIKETPSATAAVGASVVREIKIGVYPLLSSQDGVALEAFDADSTMNEFRWPSAEVGNEITISIERSVAAGAGQDVTYTAALAPHIINKRNDP